MTGRRLTAQAVVALVFASTACQEVSGPAERTPPPTSATPVAAVGTSQLESATEDMPTGLATDGFKLIAVEPLEGLITGGTEVTLRGTGLRAGMVVFFGESEAIDLFVVSSNLAVMRTPPHPAGMVDVSAYHPDIEFGAPRDLPSAFRYYADLVVGDLTPSEGHLNGGEPVTVTGSGFSADARFFLGGRQALSQARVDGNTLIGVTPPGAFGPADLHVVSDGQIAVKKDAFNYRTSPTLTGVEPISGLSAGGTLVTLRGTGMTPTSAVTFGEESAEVMDVSKEGTWIEVKSPAGPGGSVVDVALANDWGIAVATGAWTWTDDTVDPYILSCATLWPDEGPSDGGQEVELSCWGLHYAPSFFFDGQQAEVLALDPGAGRAVVRTPPGSGVVDVEVVHDFAAVSLTSAYRYVAPAGLTIHDVTPASGPTEGGTLVTIKGQGFEANAVVFIGPLPASDVTFIDANEIRATTPEGSAGLADVRVFSSGAEAVATDAFEFTNDALSLALVTPATVAQAGGTYMRVYGTGFDETTDFLVGDTPCEIISRISGAELHARSPKLSVGVYDAVVVRGVETRVLQDAIVVYDPRSGYGGTWGEAIDETVNITVRGTNGYGPIPGAFVMLGEEPATPLKGYTDENGQITFSEPGLSGPVVVTASHPDFYSYSIVIYDATNATVYLGLLDPPPGEPPPSPSWLPATLRGSVFGLGKYVLPPPGSCSGLAIDQTEHCQPCGSDSDCLADGFACTDVKEQGTFCAQQCLAPADCPAGYACTPTFQGNRCLPAPGEKLAKCMVTNTSGFSKEPPVQEGGWVEPYGTFELSSGRLGELAIVCFGGYRDATGIFTPTVMGVRRHIFAQNGAEVDGLDVTLNHPLDRTFRLRLMDPPRWPTGVNPPDVTFSLDLGPDGWIPFSRDLLDAGDDVWLAPRQLSQLSGELYGSKFMFYTQLRANTPNLLPRAYNLVQGVDTVAEDRLPVFDGQSWRLETAQLDADLHGIWGPSSEQLYAVGERGLILLSLGNSWTAQSSGTDATLRAIAGRAGDDIFAVGDKGTVLHHAGAGWQLVDAPQDAYRAAATAPSQPLLVAGTIRVRQWDGSQWTIVGPPTLQDIYGLDVQSDGRVAAVGSGGRIFLRDTDGSWNQLASVTDTTLRDVSRDPASDEVVAVGDEGTVIISAASSGPSVVAVPTSYDLTAVAHAPDGTLFVVGDNGVAMRRLAFDTPTAEAGQWVVDPITDYRSRAHDIFTPADGGEARIVGSAAFILGPFVHWPTMTAPAHDSFISAPTLAWTASGGAPASYNRVTVSEDTGKTRWRLIVEGSQWSVALPDILEASGISPFGSGKRRLEVVRVLNGNFDIDQYTTREFSIYRRDSWAFNHSYFYVP